MTKRLHNAAVAPKESSGPVEEFAPLAEEFARVSKEYARIDGLIAKANQQANLLGTNAMPIADALIFRDLAKRRMGLYTSLAAIAGGVNERRYREETLMAPVVPVKELQAKADEFAKQFREWDIAIQEANWAVEVEYPE